MDDALSKSERETLKAVFRLAKDGEGAHTGELAAALGVSPGTATATVKRLAGRGLLDHRPYRGVELTRAGRREAAKSMRRHRIVERFLSDMLGYAWNEADRLAGSFEHELPQEVEDRLFVAPDRPATCPHGPPPGRPRRRVLPGAGRHRRRPGRADHARDRGRHPGRGDGLPASPVPHHRYHRRPPRRPRLPDVDPRAQAGRGRGAVLRAVGL